MTSQHLRTVLENNLEPRWTIDVVFKSEIVVVNDVARVHIYTQKFNDLKETNYEIAFFDKKGQTITIKETGTKEECCSIIQEFSSHQEEEKEKIKKA